MRIYQKFLRLFYDMSLYREIVPQKLKTSIGFFFLFYLLFSLAIGLYTNIRFIPDLIISAAEVADEIKKGVLPGTNVEIKNGILTVTGTQTSINIPTPASLTLPTKNIVVVNPQADLSALASASALLSFGATDARFVSPEIDSVQTYNYSKDKLEGSISASLLFERVDKTMQSISDTKPYMPLIIALPVFLGLTVARMLYIISYSLFFVIGGLIFGRKQALSSILNLTLHTIIVADVINAAIILIYGQSYPTVFSMAFFGMTLFAYFYNSNRTNSPS